MDIRYFKKYIEPKLINYKLIYDSFPNGDFGALERVSIEGNDKIGSVNFWSQGWLGIDIYDLVLDELIMNVLLEPKELKEQEIAINKFLGILLNEK